MEEKGKREREWKDKKNYFKQGFFFFENASIFAERRRKKNSQKKKPTHHLSFREHSGLQLGKAVVLGEVILNSCFLIRWDRESLSCSLKMSRVHFFSLLLRWLDEFSFFLTCVHVCCRYAHISRVLLMENKVGHVWCGRNARAKQGCFPPLSSFCLPIKKPSRRWDELN